MNYILEAILVGIYTYFIYLLFTPFIKNLYILLLVVGYFKHFLGSSFGLWTWYCNNGEACLKVLAQDQNYEANTLHLIRDSLLESILFLVAGFILSFKLTNGILFFTIGVLLHIISEKLLVHKYFCKTTCDIETN
jgi:hypothetical protein